MCGRCTRAWLPSLRSHTPPHSSYLSASTSFFYLPARPTHMCMCTLVFSVRSEPAENARYCYIIIIVIVRGHSRRSPPVFRCVPRTSRPVCPRQPGRKLRKILAPPSTPCAPCSGRSSRGNDRQERGVHATGSRCSRSVVHGQRMRGYMASRARPLTASRARGGPPV